MNHLGVLYIVFHSILYDTVILLTNIQPETLSL